MRWRVCLALILFGTVIIVAWNVNMPPGIRPVAISSLRDGKLIGLDGSNTLMIVDTRTGAVEKINLPSWYRIVDLAASGELNRDIYIFGAARGDDFYHSPILQYTLDGREKKKWLLRESYPSGIAFDNFNKILYISTLQDTSIYKIDLKESKGGTPRFLLQVAGANRLGALVVDPVNNRMFVADPVIGTVYTISLATGKSSALVRELGEPNALALGLNSRLLYIADCAHRCIWSVRLDQISPMPNRFWATPELIKPLGLAVDADGIVWIADRSAQAIFGVNPQGHQVNCIRQWKPLIKD